MIAEVAPPEFLFQQVARSSRGGGGGGGVAILHRDIFF